MHMAVSLLPANSRLAFPLVPRDADLLKQAGQ